MNFLITICARGGSKGIPGKNIKCLNGLPLIAYSIKHANKFSSEYKIVLMCSEKEPLECHRTLLISRSIETLMVKVLHIQRDGQIESQTEAIQRLLKIWKLDTPNLFGEDAERIDEAFTKQESKYAYFDENKIV